MLDIVNFKQQVIKTKHKQFLATLPIRTYVRLGVSWIAVIWFSIINPLHLDNETDANLMMGTFVVLFSIILLNAFGVVREADQLSRILGEPYGTLILTLSIVSIEVILISSILLGNGEDPSIGKNAIFSVMMIILNLVLGSCILVDCFRHKNQAYNKTGSLIYIVLIILFTSLGLGLPDFIGTDGAFSFLEVLTLSAITLIIYGIFLSLQMGPLSQFFAQPNKYQVSKLVEDNTVRLEKTAVSVNRSTQIWTVILHSTLLMALMVPIVLLSHDLATAIDFGIAAIHAPSALSGLIIAIIVFTPESITALKAAWRNEMVRVVNLCLGAFLSTVGLTVPAVLIIGLIANKTVLLGMNRNEAILFIATMVINLITFNARKKRPLYGLLHLGLFVLYFVTLL